MSRIKHRILPDYLRPGLDVVFVGFNPGDRSAQIGHYYAGRGNQFWNFLWQSGLTPERLQPEEDDRVVEFGLGLTDVVKRWSPSASSLRTADYRRGARLLMLKLQKTSPKVVALKSEISYDALTFQSAALVMESQVLAGGRVIVLSYICGRNGS